MDVRIAYCSACDQNVRVLLDPGQEPMVVEGDDPHDLVCLEYGEKCTGDMCPLFKVPPEKMRENLARHLSREGSDSEGE
ncbi:MAG: hypothetical protein PVI57_02460 [Gemmatimonadota bacterium]|jgi:hypothetical protein